MRFKKAKPTEANPEGHAPSLNPRWVPAILCWLGEVESVIKRRYSLRNYAALNPGRTPAPITPAVTPAVGDARQPKKRYLPWKEFRAVQAQKAREAAEAAAAVPK